MGEIDLRCGRWEEALADVQEVDAVISDLAAGCAITDKSPQVVSIRIPGRKYVDHPRAKTFDSLTFDAALAAVPR